MPVMGRSSRPTADGDGAVWPQGCNGDGGQDWKYGF
jgi:hypothetical protein